MSHLIKPLALAPLYEGVRCFSRFETSPHVMDLFRRPLRQLPDSWSPRSVSVAAGSVFRDFDDAPFQRLPRGWWHQGTLENQALKYMYESSGQRRAGHGTSQLGLASDDRRAGVLGVDGSISPTGVNHWLAL